jgi:hypothetical protein
MAIHTSAASQMKWAAAFLCHWNDANEPLKILRLWHLKRQQESNWIFFPQHQLLDFLLPKTPHFTATNIWRWPICALKCGKYTLIYVDQRHHYT